jgi:hypothetical protein
VRPRTRFFAALQNDREKAFLYSGSNLLNLLPGVREVYNEKIHKDNIRNYAGGGDDPPGGLSGKVHLLPYLCRYSPELYAGVSGGIAGKGMRL